jgi:hypothetical protein
MRLSVCLCVSLCACVCGLVGLRALMSVGAHQGGRILYGGKVLHDRPGNFVLPTVTAMPHDAPLVHAETFAPILHTMTVKVRPLPLRLHLKYPAPAWAWEPKWRFCGYVHVSVCLSVRVHVHVHVFLSLCVMCVQSLEEAIAVNNEVCQGLTSALFSANPSSIFQWLGCVRACVRASRYRGPTPTAHCVSGCVYMWARAYVCVYGWVRLPGRPARTAALSMSTCPPAAPRLAAHLVCYVLAPTHTARTQADCGPRACTGGARRCRRREGHGRRPRGW